MGIEHPSFDSTSRAAPQTRSDMTAPQPRTAGVRAVRPTVSTTVSARVLVSNSKSCNFPSGRQTTVTSMTLRSEIGVSIDDRFAKTWDLAPYGARHVARHKRSRPGLCRTVVRARGVHARPTMILRLLVHGTRQQSNGAIRSPFRYMRALAIADRAAVRLPSRVHRASDLCDQLCPSAREEEDGRVGCTAATASAKMGCMWSAKLNLSPPRPRLYHTQCTHHSEKSALMRWRTMAQARARASRRSIAPRSWSLPPEFYMSGRKLGSG